MISFDEPFDTLLTNLLDPGAPLRAAVIYRLSEPSADELTQLKSAWPAVPVERRRLLISRMAESSETNFELDFTDVARLALHDVDAEVRKRAIDALWTSERPDTMYEFVDILQHDPESHVRANAAGALGQFVLLGDLGNVAPETSRDAEQALWEYGLQDIGDVEVYRRSLESLAFSSRPEVQELIGHASEQDDVNLRASALFAMGRSGDHQWARHVYKALNDPEPQLRFEAVRAAGELGLADAVPRLAKLARNQEDREIQEITIWALGEIGGAEAQHALLELADSVTDENLLEAVEDAVNTAALSLGQFGMYVMGTVDDDNPNSGLDEPHEIDDEQS